jgi:hypothetical protein
MLAPFAQTIAVALDHFFDQQPLPLAVMDFEQCGGGVQRNVRVIARDCFRSTRCALQWAGEDRIQRLMAQALSKRFRLTQSEFGKRRIHLPLVPPFAIPYTFAVANDDQAHRVVFLLLMRR